MADDIVTRLRDYACRGAVYATNDMASDAADEIERLRAAGDALVDYLGHDHAGSAIVRAAWEEARRG